MSRLSEWVEERTGLGAGLRRWLDVVYPGGARWAYAWGTALLLTLCVQALTGVLLASHYAPSTSTAWASVAYIEDQMSFGWFVRGMHSAGADALIVLQLLHLLQTTFFGAYKRPREVTWITGLLLLGLTLAFAHTGYQLPWDQKAYAATQVMTSLIGATPLVGPTLQRLLQGGDSFGNLTLTHLFAIHVLLLPALVALFVVAHLRLFRRHGPTPLEAKAKSTRPSTAWFPEQALRDLTLFALVLGAMAWRTVSLHGAPLSAPADPTAPFEARPEWYFLPLFQFLKLFPGSLEAAAALGAPAVVFGMLAALPFVDRDVVRSPRRRVRYLGAVVGLLGAAGAFGVAAVRSDVRSENVRKQRVRAEKESTRARKLALLGVPPAGGVAVYDNDPLMHARKLYADRCAGCHLLEGAGENKAPTLDGWSSRAWIASVLREPDADHNYGKTKIHKMKPVKGTDEQLAALTEYVYALGRNPDADAALAKTGETLFQEMDCDDCHEVDGETSGTAPNLGDRATVAWTRAFLADPGDPLYFGEKNDMPRFGEKLSADDLDALAKFLVSLRVPEAE